MASVNWPACLPPRPSPKRVTMPQELPAYRGSTQAAPEPAARSWGIV
jgi:hypothetical protein